MRLANVELVPFNRLREEMDRLFTAAAPLTGLPIQGMLGRQVAHLFPALNVWEENDTFFVEAEVPGMGLNDLEVTVTGNEVTVAGERKSDSEEGAAYHRHECWHGKFRRSVELPAEVDATKVEAVLNNGVLLLTLPKAEAAKPRKIAVKSA